MMIKCEEMVFSQQNLSISHSSNTELTVKIYLNVSGLLKTILEIIFIEYRKSNVFIF